LIIGEGYYSADIPLESSTGSANLTLKARYRHEGTDT
jgi:hypothetical protein